MNYFFYTNQKRQGPYNFEELEFFVRKGVIIEKSSVYDENNNHTAASNLFDSSLFKDKNFGKNPISSTAHVQVNGNNGANNNTSGASQPNTSNHANEQNKKQTDTMSEKDNINNEQDDALGLFETNDETATKINQGNRISTKLIIISISIILAILLVSFFFFSGISKKIFDKKNIAIDQFEILRKTSSSTTHSFYNINTEAAQHALNYISGMKNINPMFSNYLDNINNYMVKPANNQENGEKAVNLAFAHSGESYNIAMEFRNKAIGQNNKSDDLVTEGFRKIDAGKNSLGELIYYKNNEYHSVINIPGEKSYRLVLNDVNNAEEVINGQSKPRVFDESLAKFLEKINQKKLSYGFSALKLDGKKSNSFSLRPFKLEGNLEFADHIDAFERAEGVAYDLDFDTQFEVFEVNIYVKFSESAQAKKFADILSELKGQISDTNLTLLFLKELKLKVNGDVVSLSGNLEVNIAAGIFLYLRY